MVTTILICLGLDLQEGKEYMAEWSMDQTDEGMIRERKDKLWKKRHDCGTDYGMER